MSDYSIASTLRWPESRLAVTPKRVRRVRQPGVLGALAELFGQQPRTFDQGRLYQSTRGAVAELIAAAEVVAKGDSTPDDLERLLFAVARAKEGGQ